MKKQQTFLAAAKQLSGEELKKITGGKTQAGVGCAPGFYQCLIHDPCCEIACCSGGPDEYVSYCLIAIC